jgi:signal recognition particle GTPase
MRWNRRRDGADLLMIDTAGLQNRADLMEEPKRRASSAKTQTRRNTCWSDARQNALSQVKTFQELRRRTGLIMTKLDGTHKGGVLRRW